MAKASSQKQNTLERNKRGNFKVVVGIDFGTDGSGIAWSRVDGDGTVYTDQEWNGNQKFVDIKTKTNILLNANGDFIAFGREATEKYIRQFEDDDSDTDDDDDVNNDNDDSKKSANKVSKMLYFSGFKMALYKKAIKKQSQLTRGQQQNDSDSKSSKEEFKTDIRTELTAQNGMKLPSQTVFVSALRFMKEQAFQMFSFKNLEINDSSEIKWVLTVPAIWSDKSKGLMEKWAVQAGLISGDRKVINQLMIAYEPDCASISIQNEIKNHEKQKKSKNAANKNAYLLSGERYMLLDLGGGTADIACHEIVSDLAVKEVYPASGGAWGSMYIDRYFLRLLTDLFPRAWIVEFQLKYPSVYTELLCNFQRSKESFYRRNKYDKESVSNDNSQTHNITMPSTFIEFLENKLPEYNEQRNLENKAQYKDISDFFSKVTFLGSPGQWTLEDDKLELNYSIWKTMFDSVIDSILSHCKSLLSMDGMNDGKCRYACLVGGFSSSRYLQQRIMFELGIKSDHKLRIIVPKRPALSVVDGAVRLGLAPAYIAARKAAKTYGIRVNAPISKFDLTQLPKELISKNRYWNSRANQYYLHNIFHAYVRCGDEIAMTDEAITTKFYASKKNVVGIDVFASDEKDVVFIDGLPCAKKDVTLPKDWNIKNTFPISFFFGDTTIRVFADIDGIEEHEKEIHLEYEF